MRALLSVYDKTGIVDLARGLADLGWELVSSGGTSAALQAAGLDVITVESVTGSPEMLGDRVKTLHPKIHGGLLADRDDPSHIGDLEKYDITPIDLVVSNLYPFSSDPSIQLIDIGGPAMVRAAAKNHAHLGVVTDPADYAAVLDELRVNGTLSAETKKRLAREKLVNARLMSRPGSPNRLAYANARSPTKWRSSPAVVNSSRRRCMESVLFFVATRLE